MDKEKFIEIFEENRLTFLHGNLDGIRWLLKEIAEDESDVWWITGTDVNEKKHFLGMWIKRSEVLRKMLDKHWNCHTIQLSEIYIARQDSSNFGILAVKYVKESVRKQAEYIWKNDIKAYCESNNITLS